MRWKQRRTIIFALLWMVILLHFLKDITQDILRIPTPFDYLGNVHEDLTALSPVIQHLYYYGLGGLSFLIEIFLVVAIPVVIRRNQYSQLEKWCWVSVIALLTYLVSAAFFDPYYQRLIFGGG